MRIALDVDGVLADVMRAWLGRTNPGRLVPITTDDMAEWDFWRRFNIGRRDFYAELDACWGEDWESIPPTEPDLAGAAASLCNLGDVDIVTARSASTDRYVRLWLDRHGICYERYVSVAAGPMKADLDGYDVFIDDSPINAEAFLRRGRRMILYEQPWNASVRASPGIVRVRSLSAAADQIASNP